MPSEISFTVKERLLLLNQYKILEALRPEDADYYRKAQEVLEYGYEAEYDNLARNLWAEGVSDDGCHWVWDVLGLHDRIWRSWQELADKDGLEEHNVRFPGFDGNAGDGFMAYARFLATVERRWVYTLEGRPNWDFNSHSSVNGMYNMRLDRWAALGKPNRMSAAQIRAVLYDQ